jgi:hypothetical protein
LKRGALKHIQYRSRNFFQFTHNNVQETTTCLALSTDFELRVRTAVSHRAHAPHPSPRSDFVGTALSLLCVVHCLATPVILSALPSVGAVFAHAHPWLFAAVIPVALWAFIPAFRHHGDKRVLGLACAGIAFLALAAFWETAGSLEIPFSLVGAGLLVTAHWFNQQRLRACRH